MVWLADFNMKYKTEAFDLWQYLCANTFDPLIRCRMDFSGFVDEDVLKQAVTVSLNTIPMISCGFGGDGCRPRWIDKGFTGNDMVHVIEACKNAEADIFQCLSARIDFANEPQLKISIVRKSDGDTLCIIISHMICDAAGFKQYLYLLSENYTKLKNKETIVAPAFSPRGIEPLFSNITLKEKIKILRSKYTAYKPANTIEQSGIDLKSENFVTAMEKRIISSESFNKLKFYAKSNGATVNDCLMALFARAFCKNTGTDKIMFPSTMDLRKFIPQGEKYGSSNYSSNCICTTFVKPEDTLADTVAQVSKQMNAHKSDKNILKSVMLWGLAVHAPWPLIKRKFPKYAIHPLVSFTNLGIIDQRRLSFNEVVINDAYLTASIKPRPYLQLTASTYDGRCTLGCNIYGSEADQIFVRKLLNDICTEIETL